MPGFNPFDVTTKRVLNKLGGDKITAKKYTFDGNTEGRIVVPFDQYHSFVKISDDIPNLHELTSLAFSFGVVVGTDFFVIQDVKLGDDTMYGAVGMMAIKDDLPGVVVITDTASSPIPETGLYVYMDSDGATWISSIEFAETIVPIDQKYLGGYEKKMLYDGSPTKMDLSAAGMGYAYLLSSDDLFSLACGQNVHFEYTLASGAKKCGVLTNYDYMDTLSVPLVYGAFSLLYAPTLGGTGVSFNYADIGEISNLKLWTEYSENKPYYVTGYYNVGTNAQFIPVELEKAKAAALAMRLMVRYLDIGGNTIHYIPTQTFGTSDALYITVTEGNLTVHNGLVQAGW